MPWKVYSIVSSAEFRATLDRPHSHSDSFGLSQGSPSWAFGRQRQLIPNFEASLLPGPASDTLLYSLN